MDAIILRNAGPNEKRVIIRHDLGLYSNIAVGGIYHIPCNLIPESKLQQVDTYVFPLTRCVQKHPLLSATIRGADTNSPVFTRLKQLNLENHVRLLHTGETGSQFDAKDENEDVASVLQQTLERIHNHPSLAFASVESRPAWALDILPLSNRANSEFHRLFVSFTYSHSHGDGLSGIIFHRTFYEALQDSLGSKRPTGNMIIDCPAEGVYDQPDTPSKLPISLSYLLLPALGTYLPAFLSKRLGISGNVSGADSHTWTGSKTFLSAKDGKAKVATKVEVLEIEAHTLAHVIALCKRNGIKLTALLNHTIAQAMYMALNVSNDEVAQYTNFVATIPVNLRKAVGEPEDTIGNFGGATYLRYEFGSSMVPVSKSSWILLREQGQQLSRVASNTQDQPIGLLRFVAHFASWMQAKVGQSRDGSWELSNLGSFDPYGYVRNGHSDRSASIERMVFSQPASVDGPPLTFNTIATKNGSLNICISWQPGSLTSSESAHNDKSPNEGKDRECVRQIATMVKETFKQLANMA